MTTPKHFGHPTSWGKDPSGSSFGGWYSPGADHYIGPADPVWGSLLDEARKTYGDNEIHFDTGKTWEDRHLVFGDGTRLPADGTVVYHDRASGQNWVQNDDGTAALVGPDGRPGAPVAPAGYRKIDEGYAPLDATGRQIAPQLGGIPSSDNGFHTDPATGVLTPKNADGAYYTLGPDGARSYFDRHGAPISEADYRGTPVTQRPPDAGPPTTEQQSGRAAEAVRKLQSELKQRFSTISDAEERLSEILLNARTATATGQGTLNDIQRRIVEAVNNPAMDTGTAAGEKAYLTFLRSQAKEIRDVLATASLTADQQAGAAQALATLYGVGEDADPPTAESQPAPAASSTDADASPPAPPSPDLAGPEPTDELEGLDPAWSDLPAASMDPVGSAAVSPLSQMAPLASTLPGTLGGLGSASPLDGLGGLIGSAGPLAGLGSQLGAQPAPAPVARDRAESDTDKPEPAHDDKHGLADHDATDKPEQPKTDAAEHDADPATPVPGGPPAPIAPPASPTVKLPDGSTANARTPQAAQAIRDWLAGNTVDASYRQNGITLPPPGTPVTDPVDPSRLACGDVAMFRDHYEPVLSSVKGYLNGQVVPLSTVTTRPDFLGFIDPTSSTAARAVPPPLPSPAAEPVPAG